ncbi:hypothetical protein AB0L34_24400 [Micromonospora sp. NPDC052213]|uniref:hypothetical protein n=1 Tax=Micromonospora sp. NPDC052213 TaxID=3155812 RepID=UPI003445B7EB
MARRVRGVEMAWAVTVALGSTLRQLADLARPGQYLPPFEPRLRGLLHKAREAYCAAITEALDAAPPYRIEARQNEGDRLVGEFSATMPQLYLTNPMGLEAVLGQLADQVTDLVALRAEREDDALPRPAADAETRVTMTAPGRSRTGGSGCSRSSCRPAARSRGCTSGRSRRRACRSGDRRGATPRPTIRQERRRPGRHVDSRPLLDEWDAALDRGRKNRRVGMASPSHPRGISRKRGNSFIYTFECIAV